MLYVNLVYEDSISGYLLKSIIKSANPDLVVNREYQQRGSGRIKTSIEGYNQASKFSPYIILTDLDAFECPPALIQDWFSSAISPNLIFCIAVKEVESWQLADKTGFANFTGVPVSKLKFIAEEEPDPKQKLINLVRHSRKREIREDIIPIFSDAAIGPYYNQRLMQFVDKNWSIDRAKSASKSLSRAFSRIKNLSSR